MPLHLLRDPTPAGSPPDPDLDRLAERVRLASGRILTSIDAGPDGAKEAVDRSGLSPDEIFFPLRHPSRLEAARRARVRACAIEPDASLRDHWDGVDELWRDVHEASRWMDRQLQLESRAWPVATVGGLVFRGDHKAFFVRTAKWSGTWGVPGGKIEYGEPSEAAFAREIREETGLEVRDVRFVLLQDAIEEPEFHRARHFLLLNYTASTRDDSIRLNHESLEGGWFGLGEALGLPLNRPTRVLVEHVLKAARI